MSNHDSHLTDNHVVKIAIIQSSRCDYVSTPAVLKHMMQQSLVRSNDIVTKKAYPWCQFTTASPKASALMG